MGGQFTKWLDEGGPSFRGGHGRPSASQVPDLDSSTSTANAD